MQSKSNFLPASPRRSRAGDPRGGSGRPFDLCGDAEGPFDGRFQTAEVRFRRESRAGLRPLTYSQEPAGPSPCPPAVGVEVRLRIATVRGRSEEPENHPPTAQSSITGRRRRQDARQPEGERMDRSVVGPGLRNVPPDARPAFAAPAAPWRIGAHCRRLCSRASILLWSAATWRFRYGRDAAIPRNTATHHGRHRRPVAPAKAQTPRSEAHARTSATPTSKPGSSREHAISPGRYLPPRVYAPSRRVYTSMVLSSGSTIQYSRTPALAYS